MFKSIIGRNHEEFKTAQQQDTQEYFQHLMKEVIKGEKMAKRRSPTETFDFDLETKLQCTECKGIKFKKDTVS